MTLPIGSVCDVCQRYYGSKIESVVLHEPPFSVIRTHLGIRTKKRRLPFYKNARGEVVSSTGSLGMVELRIREKDSARAARIGEHRIEMALEPSPKSRRIIARFLVKMGLEVVAREPNMDHFDPRFDLGREFSRRGRVGVDWWYLQHVEPASVERLVRGSPSRSDLNPWVTFKLLESPTGGLLFWLQLAFADFLAPLDPATEPPPELTKFRETVRVTRV